MSETLTQLIEQATSEAPHATRAAGRLISALENEPERVAELLRLAGERARQPRMIVGLTGAPGSGKSTLTDALIGEYRRRHAEARLGAIAVDPSSPFTGGAVLGDRVRMMRHATDPNVFVRSLASRGTLGGLSLGVKAVTRVMGLIGCDMLLIETVGVGQSEIEIARVADHVVVVLAPGQGDAVQLLKAGLLEIGDLFVVNKADRPGADELVHALETMWQHKHRHDRGDDAHAGAPRDAEPSAPVLRVVATEGEGVGALLDELERMVAAETDDARRARRDAALRDELRSAILELIRRGAERALASDELLDEHLQRVRTGETSIEDLAGRLLDQVLHEPTDEPR